MYKRQAPYRNFINASALVYLLLAISLLIPKGRWHTNIARPAGKDFFRREQKRKTVNKCGLFGGGFMRENDTGEKHFIGQQGLTKRAVIIPSPRTVPGSGNVQNRFPLWGSIWF